MGRDFSEIYRAVNAPADFSDLLKIAIVSRLRCLVPGFDGASLSSDSKDALWDKFFMGAPQQQRRSVERYSIVKRA